MKRRTTRDRFVNLKTPISDNIYHQISTLNPPKYVINNSTYDGDRSMDIINKSSDFYVIVEDVVIPRRFIPVLNIPTTISLTGITTPYTIRLEIGGNRLSLNLTLPDEGLFSTNRLNSSGGFVINRDDTTSYWFYDYEMFLKIFNDGMVNLLANIGGGVDAEIILNYNDGFSLYVSDSFYTNNNDDYESKIFMNDNLYQIINGIPAIKNTSNNNDLKSNPLTWYINIERKIFNQITYLDKLGTLNSEQLYYVFEDNRKDGLLYAANAVKRLVITTSYIPVQSEYIAILKSSEHKILWSWIPAETFGTDTYSYASSESIISLVDLTNDQALNKIDLRFYWVDMFGIMHQILLPSNSSIDLRIKFLKKQLINNFYRSDTHVR